MSSFLALLIALVTLTLLSACSHQEPSREYLGDALPASERLAEEQMSQTAAQSLRGGAGHE